MRSIGYPDRLSLMSAVSSFLNCCPGCHGAMIHTHSVAPQRYNQLTVRCAARGPAGPNAVCSCSSKACFQHRSR